MFGLGFGELVIVFLIALIFIGPKKLPELAKGLGKGIRDFQNAAKGFSDQLQESENETPKTENQPTRGQASTKVRQVPVDRGMHRAHNRLPQI
jgi:TatA/E family protein of Tat protein translocase